MVEKRLPIGSPGTVLFAMYASLGAVAILGVDATWNQAILGVQGRDGVADNRFIAYWLEHLSRDLSALARTNTQDNLNAEQVANLPFPTLAVEDQRRIADFLDSETARIDALIKKKRRMIALLLEHSRQFADAVVWTKIDREIPLMHRVDLLRPVMYGIVLPGPDVSEGIPIVKGGDLSAHPLTLDRLCRTTLEIERPYARARLQRDDVLFAIRGGVGDAALVPDELEGANITQDVARVAPSRDIEPEWLLHVLRSETFQHRAGALITGATIKGLNIRDLERIRIPWSVPERQHADLAAIRPVIDKWTRLDVRLKHQIELLIEHRQALITASVTGELDIAKAAA